MEKKKTVLLLCPHLLNKNGVIWQLLHISKDNIAVSYTAEAIIPGAAKKHFSRLPEGFYVTLNKFSEKTIGETRQELIAMGKKMENNESNSHSVQTALERWLHQQFTTLRPLLPMIPCYHQTPSPQDARRFRTSPCTFSNYTPSLRFQVRKAEEEYLYPEVEVDLNGSFYPLSSFVQTGFLLEHKNEYFILRYNDYRTLSWLQEMKWEQEGKDASIFADKILSRLEKEYTVSRNSLLNSVELAVEPTGRILMSEISGQFLMLTPQFDYDGFLIDGPYQEKTIFNREGKEYSITRNKTSELSIIEKVEKLSPNFPKQLNGYYYLSFEAAQNKNWFIKAYRQLLEAEIEVAGMDMLKHFRYSADKPITTLQVVKQEGDFVVLSFSLSFGNEKIPFTELQKVVRAGQQALALQSGAIAVLDEDWLRNYNIIVKHAVVDKGNIRVPKWIAISLEQQEETSQTLQVLFKKDWWMKWAQWQSSEEPLYAIPETIHASLRIYQQKGYEWFRLLNEIGSGMFLADDMGLGKTLQTICFLAYIVKNNPSKKALIVCPASLMYNWQNELSKFAPTLNAFVYHGTGRDKNILEDEKQEIIISSYGTLRSDASMFSSYNFSLIILDESHAIKNPSSQITRLVHTLVADRRITLTGTPVMNNTFDLYSQLQFILPGMFISQPFFKKEYADPIDLYKNEQRVKDLQKLTAPFILRRTKEQVAKDLPPKTEMVLWCEMESDQQLVYEDVKNQIKGELKEAIQEDGLQKSKLKVLQGILKLRQVCNSPALLKDVAYNCTDSIKTEMLLDEIVNNLSNHKALVFSQFTSMLNILSAELNKKNIPFLLLTGQTPAKERDRMMQAFNSENDNNRVFLLSLKAGNAGLNLTAADYVFLFDPWWNSGVEQQAIDRTHRIGQTKNVFAYKMICRNTIEERIMLLQEQKKHLASSLVVEEEGFVKALTEDDIEYLLQ